MNAELESIKTKVDYLLAADGVRFAANVLRIWEHGEEFRRELDTEHFKDLSLEPQERLAAALAGRQLGQLRFSGREHWGRWKLDESETEWQGEHDWHVIGESELADTTAILLHAQTGETVFYDADAWDWNLRDNFIIVKDSLAAFIDEVVLGPEYERLYYQNLVELASILEVDAEEFPGIEGDPWHHLLREMRADLFDGAQVDRGRRRELNRRIEAYFADDDADEDDG
ncbi:hypothetical protein [Glycomyces buryatensis]|uniref:Uncharacterized protein n=1 Tax=Glycomyces buryatensis TaxID=2570927 RepID=A0A4S8QB90_9ACTN|nr:hypothetical protein [Glycomyces buryatensis]THV40791.1 hypothetical protein FAB82_14170 [Glycomyces buryatensis]